MIAVELAQSVVGNLADAVLAAPTPPPKGTIATTGILSFLATKIVPIMLAIVGVIFIGRAGKGEVSKVVTSSAIVIIGLAFMAGATTLFFFGENLIKIMFE